MRPCKDCGRLKSESYFSRREESEANFVQFIVKQWFSNCGVSTSGGTFCQACFRLDLLQKKKKNLLQKYILLGVFEDLESIYNQITQNIDKCMFLYLFIYSRCNQKAKYYIVVVGNGLEFTNVSHVCVSWGSYLKSNKMKTVIKAM